MNVETKLRWLNVLGAQNYESGPCRLELRHSLNGMEAKAEWVCACAQESDREKESEREKEKENKSGN